MGVVVLPDRRREISGRWAYARWPARALVADNATVPLASLPH